MITETVYSPIIHDQTTHISNSKIWLEAHHPSELSSTHGMFQYSIKFDGLKPVQLTKVKFIDNKVKV